MPSRLHALRAAPLALTFAVGLAPTLGACAAPPPPTVDRDAMAVMLSPAPPVLRYPARDGAQLAYRVFEPAASTPSAPVVAILLHGSAGNSRNMTALGDALSAAGVPAFAPDVRGQGLSGRHGDIDYIGQLDDDLADFVRVIRARYPAARLALVGHSSGGGFALRVAGEPLGRQFSAFILVAPYLGRHSPSTNPANGWTRVDVPRVALLAGLNQLGVTAFNGATTVRFNLPPQAEELGLTRAWSYRMMANYDPRGDMDLSGPPAYREDAANAAAPLVVIAGADDEQMRSARYADAFAGLARPVKVELAPGVDHMGAVSDPRSVSLIVAAVQGAGSAP